MHTIEEIIADAQSAVAASLRQAYDAGRHHQTTEMREKFVAFFDGVFAPLSGAPAAEAAAEAAPETPPTEAAAADAPAEAPVAAETPAEIPPEATAEPASAA
ncbi:MAG: hypothetical protein ABSF49_01945 [Roseiarcus sp.]|jgi:hypothetical protein|uniref:hypothetical protein n=1 Tax=Roseiarcus sp. TaxID=1969460 RepID=UPI003C1E60CB